MAARNQLLRLTAVALLALQLCSLTQAAWVPLGGRVASNEVLEGACRGQGSRTVCYPTNSVAQYLQCRPGQLPVTRICPRGQLYDYVSRRCQRSSTARTCPWWPVPRAIQFGLPDANNTNGPALSAPFGQFGVPGNFTFDLDIAGHFVLYCPLIGHGSIGQNMEYTVTCPAPADRVPYTFRVDLEPVLLNSDVYPKRVASLDAYCGDKLHVLWSGPFHLGQIGNFSPYNRALWANQLVMARPPQPVYRCPMYTYLPAPPPAPPGFVVLVPNPGDQLLISPTTDPWNVTIVANASSTFFLLDPAAAYCRMGLVFKVTVLPQAVGRTPVTVIVSWEHRNENLEDQIIYVGDTLFIHKDSFVQESALARVPSLPFINART